MLTATLPRPAEKTAIVTLILVFLCGGVLGAILMTAVHPGMHKAGQPIPVGLSVSISEWKSELDLSDEQVRQLTSTLGDFGRYYENLLADGNTRIVQVLTPAQRIRYQELLKKHRTKGQ